MKKLSFLTTLVLAASLAFSQNCKFDFDKTDPFTNVKTQRINVRGNMFFSMGFYRQNDDFRIEAYLSMNDAQNFVVPAGSKLDIKLTNGKIISIQNVADAQPAQSPLGNMIITNYAMSYKISKEDLTAIAANGITFIRTWYSDANYYDYEFKKKEPEKTTAAATCILGK
jgi:hypothetical protein